ncbi:MAG TPA: 30S ribosomal protein S6, partial [bacterium]|nr:30S ribosomal protein S6 [bacterium]
LKPALTPEATEGLLGVVKEVVAAHAGSVVKADDWGERRLTFDINKQNQGRYYLTYINTTADSVKELDRRLRLRDEVIRFMVINRPTDYFEQQKARQERIAAKKAEAEARAKMKAEAEAAAAAARMGTTAAAAAPAAPAEGASHGEPAVTQ